MADVDAASDQTPDEPIRIGSDAWQQLPTGSTTTPTTGHGGDGPPVGFPHLAEMPSPGLVAYFREPSGSLDLSTFVTSILDPPRPV